MSKSNLFKSTALAIVALGGIALTNSIFATPQDDVHTQAQRTLAPMQAALPTFIVRGTVPTERSRDAQAQAQTLLASRIVANASAGTAARTPCPATEPCSSRDAQRSAQHLLAIHTGHERNPGEREPPN